MGLMMLRKKNFPFVIQFRSNQILDPEFLLEPECHGFDEGTNANWRVGKISMEKPVKFLERFVVESDHIEFRGGNAPFRETMLNGLFRKPEIMLLAGKAFFLGGGDDLAINNQRCSAIMIKGGYS